MAVTHTLRAILVAVALSCVVAAEAAAQSSEMTLNGAQLLKACTTADHEWIGFCNGYMQAAFDATGGRGICAPKDITRNQLFDIKARLRLRGGLTDGLTVAAVCVRPLLRL